VLSLTFTARGFRVCLLRVLGAAIRCKNLLFIYSTFGPCDISNLWYRLPSPPLLFFFLSVETPRRVYRVLTSIRPAGLFSSVVLQGVCTGPPLSLFVFHSTLPLFEFVQYGLTSGSSTTPFSPKLGTPRSRSSPFARRDKVNILLHPIVEIDSADTPPSHSVCSARRAEVFLPLLNHGFSGLVFPLSNALPPNAFLATIPHSPSIDLGWKKAQIRRILQHPIDRTIFYFSGVTLSSKAMKHDDNSRVYILSNRRVCLCCRFRPSRHSRAGTS
jgi:hypothetical protein